PEHGAIEGDAGREPRALDAFAAYREAYKAWFDGDDRLAARAHIDRAAALAPREPLYHAGARLAAIALADGNGALGPFGLPRDGVSWPDRQEAPATAPVRGGGARRRRGRRAPRGRGGLARARPPPGDAPRGGPGGRRDLRRRVRRGRARPHPGPRLRRGGGRR